MADAKTATALSGGAAGAKENPVLNPTGLSDAECQEVHSFFMKGLTIWVAVSAGAHVLVWAWLPWFPGAS
ncbi:MAG: light-harvesting protein [Rhodothalassiaceae bacterium]